MLYKMEHKILNMHLGTWRKLRGVFPAKKDETMDDYMRRILEAVRCLQLYG